MNYIINSAKFNVIANKHQFQRRFLMNAGVGRKVGDYVNRFVDFFNRPRFGPVEYFANAYPNKYDPDRVLSIGPDFACLEWLMNCGSTSVYMSDGQTITTQSQMRNFMKSQGVDFKNIKKIAPDVNIVSNIKPMNGQRLSFENDKVYESRWPHISSIHIKNVDATDSVLTDRGFLYFTECFKIEKLKINHCYYFSNTALRTLSEGRLVKTLQDLEIVFNGRLTDDIVFSLIKFKALRRLHLYFLPRIIRRDAILRHLRQSLPNCDISFPEQLYISHGYEHIPMFRPGSTLTEQRHRRI